MKFFILIERWLQQLLPKKWRLTLSGIRIKVYWFLGWIATPYFYYRQNCYKKVINRLKGKEKYTVAFFAFQESIWKYESLYRAMEQHPKFEPWVVVIPYLNYGHESMLEEMKRTTEGFQKRNYRVIKTYDAEKNHYIDIKKTLNPDIVFYTTPFRFSHDNYLITNFLDRLTAYVPYGIMTVKAEDSQFNQLFHNLVWRCYYETEIHKNIACQNSYIKARNVVVSGYPLADNLMGEPKNKNVWKNQNPECKRIIWAPHHMLEKNITYYSYSTFLLFHEFFFQLVENYSGKIQVTFKPHPILRLKLYQHPEWGKEKTDQYFERWATTPNCQLEEGDYIDLFLTSDALIHDSISFISEYCYTGKPALFLMRDDNIYNTLNLWGKEALDMSYHGVEQSDIQRFIDEVVLLNNDPMRKMRQTFVNMYLKPPSNTPVYQNIINDLTSNLS